MSVLHFILDVTPGVAFVVILFAAALTARALLRRSSRGRARAAIAYLAGLGAGVTSTAAICILLEQLLDPTPALGSIGLFASLVGPFAGMLHARWLRPRRGGSGARIAAAALGHRHP